MSATRSVGSADIKFGFVSIPVKLYIAASPEKFSFNLITPKGNKIKQITTDCETGEVVEYSNLNKGIEVEKDKYVIFSKDDIENLAGEKENVIELCEVIPNTISPEDVEKSYYLSPDKADRSYRLFHDVLGVENTAAICKYYTSLKDHLVAVCAVGELLMMYQLYYQNERRELGVNFAPGSQPNDNEMGLAVQLLNQYKADACKLSSYKDEYGARVQDAIQKKVAGMVAPKRGKVSKNKDLTDLSTLLKGSLKRTKR
jgi:DNA end-binding protein Ku